MKCSLNSLNAVLEQECEITLNIATENYNNGLKHHFSNRHEPFETKELFRILKEARDQAIEEFVISGDIRDKFERYDDFLARLQDFMNAREDRIIEINDNLADE